MEAATDVIGRAWSALHAVYRHEPNGASTSQIARDCGLPRPTTHRLLTALLEHGVVDRTTAGAWTLGPELFILGSVAARRYEVPPAVVATLQALSDQTGESAFYSVRRGDESVCLVCVEGSFPLRSHVLHQGIRFPLGVASAGLAILAFLPESESTAYLESVDLAHDYGEAHGEASLRARLATARRLGYAVNPGLIVKGSIGIAAAVLDPDGRPVGAVSLTGVEHRFSPQRRPELGRGLVRAAHDVSQAIFGPGSRAFGREVR